MNNREFAEQQEGFQACCKAVDLKPTVRQASKFRREEGLAYKEGMEIVTRKAEK